MIESAFQVVSFVLLSSHLFLDFFIFLFLDFFIFYFFISSILFYFLFFIDTVLFGLVIYLSHTFSGLFHLIPNFESRGNFVHR